MSRLTRIAFNSIFAIVTLLFAACTSFSTPSSEVAESDSLLTQTATTIKPTGTLTDSTPLADQVDATPTASIISPSSPLVVTETETQTLTPTATQVELETPPDFINPLSQEAVVLYTKPVDGVYPLLSWPLIPVLDTPEFANVYGSRIGNWYGGDLAPQLSPSGQYLVLPKVDWQKDELASPDDSTTWIVDLLSGSIQEIEQRPLLAVWSPSEDKLAFVKDDTLYVKDAAEQASILLLTQPGLENLFLEWSPNGQQLAVISTEIGESIGGAYPPITNTLRIVDAGNGVHQSLQNFFIVPIEHERREFQWSKDGTAVFVGLAWPNRIYSLAGDQISLEEGDKGLGWGYDESQFILVNENGLFVVDLQNQQTEQIDDAALPLTAWVISEDRRYLAYAHNRRIYIVDLTNEFQRVAISTPANVVSSLHWTDTGNFLIFDDGNWNTPIWGISVEDKQIGVLVEFGLLLNVIKPPMLPSEN